MNVQNILVPTDFSDYANYASEVAVAIARQSKAIVHFYHQTFLLIDPSHLTEEKRSLLKEHFLDERNAIKQLEALDKQYKGEVDVKTSYGHGNLVAQLSEKIEEEAMDLLVMGTHGRDEKAYMIGSNTLKMLRLAQCPVLIVKSRQENFKIKNVLFASNFEEEALSVFQKLMTDWVKPLDARVHLFHIDVNGRFGNTPELFQKYIQKFKDLAGEHLGVAYSYPETSIEEGINHIAEEYEVDLIAIGAHNREYKSLMYATYIAESIVNVVDAPLLALHFKMEQ